MGFILDHLKAEDDIYEAEMLRQNGLGASLTTEDGIVQPESQLLPDMWAECFSHLGCERDLTVAAQVCSTWRDVVCSYDSLWESFVSRAEPWENTGR